MYGSTGQTGEHYTISFPDRSPILNLKWTEIVHASVCKRWLIRLHSVCRQIGHLLFAGSSLALSACDTFVYQTLDCNTGFDDPVPLSEFC